MTNSWSFLYDELYGDDKMNYSPDLPTDINITTGLSTESCYTTDYCVDTTEFESITLNTADFDTSAFSVPESSVCNDTPIRVDTDPYPTIGTTNPWVYESPDGGATVTRRNKDP